MSNQTLQYADIMLESVNMIDIIKFDIGDTEIKYDCFDDVISNYNDSSIEIYRIYRQSANIGYVSLYNLNFNNFTANLYGKISSKQYYGDLIKAFLVLLKYAFTKLHIKKINFEYRYDNYFFDDVCGHLTFIREGLLRGQLYYDGKLIDVNAYGMLDYEYQRLANGVYKRMFAWDYNFTPQNVMYLDLFDKFNRRLFTNSIDNPNHAWINDWLGEFVLNQTIPENEFLTYKNAKFPVSIFSLQLEVDCFSCMGQEIIVPNGNYTDLLLVTTAQFGYKQTFITAVYEDNSREECRFTVGDWCDKIVRNEFIIHYATACRSLSEKSSMIKCNAFVYLQRVSIDPKKVLKKLVFPHDHDIFVFAGAVCVN